MADILTEMAPRSLRLEIVEISRLSVYDEQRDANPPPEWRVFRQQIRAADGVLFLTPELPRALPGVIENALNIASHPSGNSVWEGKPGGVVSLSPDSMKRAGSTRRLHQALVILNVPVMQQPEAFIESTSQFDASGRLINPLTRRFLTTFMGAFNDWVHTNCRH